METDREERGHNLRAQRLPGWESAGSVAGSGCRPRIAEVDGGEASISRSANGIVQPSFLASASTFAASWAISLVNGCIGIAAKTVSESLAHFRACSGLSAMQAVLQFDHGNGREHEFGFSVLTFECRQQLAYRSGVTLGADQDAGVQD